MVYEVCFNSARKRVPPYPSMKLAQEGGKDAGSNLGFIVSVSHFVRGSQIAPTDYRVRNLRESCTGELADCKPPLRASLIGLDLDFGESLMDYQFVLTKVGRRIVALISYCLSGILERGYS